MLRLTLAQMLKLVAFSAVGLSVPIALTTPGAPGTFQGLFVGLGSLMLVPIAWAVLSLLIVRPGPRRDRLVWSLLLGSLSVLLAYLGLTFGLMLLVQAQGQPGPWLLLVVLLVLGGLWLYLLGRIRQRRSVARPTTPPSRPPSD